MKIMIFLMTLTATATPLLAAGGDANPFAGRIYQAIAAAVVFLGLLFVLKSKAWGPILKGLQNREEKIKGDLEGAEKANKQAAETLASYQKQLAEADAEARKILDQARTDAERIAAEITNKTQTEITAMRQRAEADITAAKERAVRDMYAQAANLSTQIAGRILQREISADDQQALISQSLAEFTAQNN